MLISAEAFYWDASRDQLTFGGGSAAPFPDLDKSDVEWARLQTYSGPSKSGSAATEQDICNVARRITGELSGVERSLVPVRKGMPSKAYYTVGRGHHVGVYHNYVEVQQQTDAYTSALFMAFLTLSEAQFWIDEDRAAQICANGPAVKVAHGAAGEKFYAVLRGRRLGVFNSWHEAQRSTDGFPHSRHKPFDTHGAATAWLERKNLVVATEREASANADRLRDRTMIGDSPVLSPAISTSITYQRLELVCLLTLAQQAFRYHGDPHLGFHTG